MGPTGTLSGAGVSYRTAPVAPSLVALNLRGTVTCAAGEQAIGGGVLDSSGIVTTQRSYPSNAQGAPVLQNPQSWSTTFGAAVLNTSATVYAVCVPLG